MAANKFATMVHRNTNKITLILVYAVLEWILIVLLLLNSLFSYLIIKFADYFGLKKPCLWCSRLDHVFESHGNNNNKKSKNLYRDLVCKTHAEEISELGFCSNHQKLSESRDMCENCLSSSSSNDWSNNGKVSFFPWMNQIGMIKGGDLVVVGDDNDDDEKVVVVGDEEEEKEESLDCSCCEEAIEEETIKKDVSVPHLEFYIGQEDCTLIPVEFSSNKVEEQGKSSNEKEEEDLILDFDMSSGVAKQVEQVTETWVSSGDTLELLSSNECIQSDESRRNSFAFHGEQVQLEITREFQKVLIHQATQTLSDDEDFESGHGQAMSRRGEIDLDVNQASEDEIDDAEVSIGTDIPDHDEPIDEIQSKQDPSSSSINLHSDDNNHDDFDEAEEEVVEFKTLSVETNNNHLFFGLELNDNDEEKFHKKLLLLERRESGTEESLDGSVLSDIESGGDGILTMEKLKSVLKSERKALNALYAELEEERSASAVAASQTMAMINRLQEEKAAMQMEALQYQRMMEEQSEYDQEALQLLNDLMTKRERENQELERELEMYRKRIQDYEAKEKIMVRRMREESIITRSRNSSMSCSNAEDTSDELSVDLNHEAKAEEEDCVGGDNQNTPADAVLYLDESLNGFEEERLSILDQLRVLEEKLFTLQTDEEDRCFEDVKPIEVLYKENGNGYHDNGHVKEMNGKHHQQERRIMGSKAKRLLPFFDATEEENEDGEESFDFVMMQSPEFERENKKFAIEEEVDHVYERLQALEADREFLKHCISSLSKGDKGLHLLQEILQHLRDLRSVETRVKNMGDVSLIG
ncbi:hypothetical protein F8388_015166 [Cannabis sativa]|uniref:GTD-binding domain-containing protein n=1 Tax=Cannabis sativa TaxID=3483 RepID=A0A7J6EQY5_CANSA|nr:hypothetical protein F8388_015166 [Cannabis sativa]